MIQGLLGGVVEERKTISHLIDHSPTSSTISSPSSSLTSAAAAGDQQQNLRCPRCDSTNTKFCYYNNYNLTQPRHFCKTCRRYWTKGGALRNVPIGGGCRKTKVVPAIAAAVCGAKPAPNKAKPPGNGSDLMLRSGLGGAVAGCGGMDSDFSASSPLLWTSPHTSHLMSLLRSGAGVQSSATHCGLNLGSPAGRVKEDRSLLCSSNAADLNAHALSLDPLSQLGLGASLFKNHLNNGGNYSYQQPLPQSRPPTQQNGNNLQTVCEMPSSEIQDLYQKFKYSSNYYNEPLQTVISNANGGFDHSSRNGSSASSSMLSNSSIATTASSATMTTILDPIPQLSTAAEFGYWNNSPSLPAWSDLPTPNGAFH